MANDFDEWIGSISPRQTISGTNENMMFDMAIKPAMDGASPQSHRRDKYSSRFWRYTGKTALATVMFLTSIFAPTGLTNADPGHEAAKQAAPTVEQTVRTPQQQARDTKADDAAAERRRDAEALQRALDAVQARVTAAQAKQHKQQSTETGQRTEAQRAAFKNVVHEIHKQYEQELAQRAAAIQAEQDKAAAAAKAAAVQAERDKADAAAKAAAAIQKQNNARIRIAALQIKQSVAGFFKNVAAQQRGIIFTVPPTSPKITSLQGLNKRHLQHTAYIRQLHEGAAAIAQKKPRLGMQQVPDSAYEICANPFDLGAFLKTAASQQPAHTPSPQPAEQRTAKSEPVSQPSDKKKAPVVLHAKRVKTKVAERIRAVFQVVSKKTTEQKPVRIYATHVKHPAKSNLSAKKTHHSAQKTAKVAEQKKPRLPFVVLPNKDEIPDLLRDRLGIKPEFLNTLSTELRAKLHIAASLGGVNFEAYKQSIDPRSGVTAATYLFDVADALFAKDNKSYIAARIYKQACDVARQSEFMLSPRAASSIANYAALLWNTTQITQATYMASIARIGDPENKLMRKVLEKAEAYDPELADNVETRVAKLNEFGMFGSLQKAARTIIERTQEAGQKKEASQDRQNKPRHPVSYRAEQNYNQPLADGNWSATGLRPTYG